MRRLFNLPYKTHSRYLPLLCNDFPVDPQLIVRFSKFMYKVFTSENECVQLAGKVALNGSQSSICKSVLYPSFYSVIQTRFNYPHFSLEC